VQSLSFWDSQFLRFGAILNGKEKTLKNEDIILEWISINKGPGGRFIHAAACNILFCFYCPDSRWFHERFALFMVLAFHFVFLLVYSSEQGGDLLLQGENRGVMSTCDSPSLGIGASECFVGVQNPQRKSALEGPRQTFKHRPFFLFSIFFLPLFAHTTFLWRSLHFS